MSSLSARDVDSFARRGRYCDGQGLASFAPIKNVRHFLEVLPVIVEDSLHLLESEDLATEDLLEASPGMDARKVHPTGTHRKCDAIRLYADDSVSAF